MAKGVAGKMRISKGDRVRVIRGNFRDQEGTVLRILTKEQRVVVEGVNMRKRHARPTQANPEGGIISFEAPIHVSNVMLVDPASGEPSRVRMRVEADGSVSAYTGKVVTWEEALGSELDLSPPAYEWGALEVRPPARPS